MYLTFQREARRIRIRPTIAYAVDVITGRLVSSEVSVWRNGVCVEVNYRPSSSTVSVVNTTKDNDYHRDRVSG